MGIELKKSPRRQISTRKNFLGLRFFLIIINRGSQGLVAEDGTVDFALGQAAELFDDLLRCDFIGLV